MVERIMMFPGQGAQYTGMGKDLYEHSAKVRELFELASEICRKDMRELIFSDDESSLQQTENTQIAVTLIDASILTMLGEQGIEPTRTAGFSLGELTAYHASGMIDTETLFSLAVRRGSLMASYAQRIEERIGGLGMAAVVGMDFQRAQDVFSEHLPESLYIANDNSPRQIVIAGLKSSIEQMTPVLKTAGARRIVPLKVSAPFHTPFMQEAAQEFSTFLEDTRFADPKIPVYSNVTGSVIDRGIDAKGLCIRQITSPVRWTAIVKDVSERIAEDAEIYEAGPGKVLTGFWKAGPSQIPCIPVGTFEAVMTAGEQE